MIRRSSERWLTDSAAVEEAIKTILDNPARQKSYDENECVFYQIRAAMAMGYSEPMTAEQRAMNTILSEIQAGKSCCEKAWEIYHNLRSP